MLTLSHSFTHHTYLTKNVLKEDETECSKHIKQTTYNHSNHTFFAYTGSFLPQRNLNFSNTGVNNIYIYLDIIGSSFNDSSSIEMQAYDSGKFSIKMITNLYYASQFLIMKINNNK